MKLTNSLRARAPDPVRAPAECNYCEHCDEGLDNDKGVQPVEKNTFDYIVTATFVDQIGLSVDIQFTALKFAWWLKFLILIFTDSLSLLIIF